MVSHQRRSDQSDGQHVSGDERDIKLLLDAGADVDIRCPHKRTIFHFLAGCRSLLSLDFSELQWSLFLNSRWLLKGCSGFVEVSWPPEQLSVPPSGWEQRKGADTPNLHTWRRINQQQ